MDSDRIRVRLHWGGLFECAHLTWHYVGGSVFNESVPAGSNYADLCLKVNEKVGQKTSLKYLAPGEDLSPHELVSIAGDDDLKELYDEYFNAMQRPGTPVKTFRIKMFLSPALQDELDTETRPIQRLFHPPLWMDGAHNTNYNGFELEEAPSDMQWDQMSNHSLPLHILPAFIDGPTQFADSGLFGARLGGDIAFELLGHQAVGNILRSVSRSRRRGITEEIGLPDPYHENSGSREASARRRRCNLGPDGAPLLRATGAGGNTSRLVPVEHAVLMPGMNGYSSVAKFPSHVQKNDDNAATAVGSCALSVEGLSPEVDLQVEVEVDYEALGLPADLAFCIHSTKPASMSEQMPNDTGFNLPSRISIFGDNIAVAEDPELYVMARLEAEGDKAGMEGLQRMSKSLTADCNNNAWLLRFNNPNLGTGFGEQAVVLENRVRNDIDVDAGHNKAFGASPIINTPKLLDEVCRVPMDDVHIIRKIGEGAFGEVSYANVTSHGLVAVKWLKRERFAKYSESFMCEAEVLAKLNHPNIIRMYGVVIEPLTQPGQGSGDGYDRRDSGSSRENGQGWLEPPVIIAGIMTDFVRGGSLSGQLRAAKRRPTLKERCQVAAQAGRGMAYLHSQNPAVIHFDLKPDNLLVDGDGETLHVKVADFGLSKHKFHNFVSCRDLRGTLPYMAPELVNNPNQVSERCDVWSMGVVMWEMYTLEVPYNAMTAQQILSTLMDGSIHLHIPSSCEPEWRGLIEMCMDPNPEARPTFKQLTTHLDAILRQLGC